ncbi:MAG: pyridoxamine 5'-phosphate oxidase family protein [Alistipes sp.]|nr:pyridoxamine 5'-phosphate oxidase family protein [Alistipes sp.]
MQDIQTAVIRLVDRQNTALIGSVDEAGFPGIKAMLAPRLREGLKTFYFTTNTSSKRVGHYLRDSRACIYFYDRRTFRGVMLTGYMEVLTDSASKELIWREGDTMYYSGGVTDPDYCVLRFTAERGRYYKDFESVDFEI